MEIFVGTSCVEGVDEKYLSLASEIGYLIGINGHTLIFGSSENGMMGRVYRKAKENGGKVISVIPDEYRGFLTDVEADEIIRTKTASEQLKVLVNKGDITIIMPGSFGTLSELMTSIHYKKLGEHHKRIFILNKYGFFDEFLKLVDKIFLEGFDYSERKKLFEVVESPHEIFEKLKGE